MLNHPTYDKLTHLKLFGMARAFAEQSPLDLEHLGFEERLGLLVEQEMSERNGKALTLRRQRAKLKPNTAAEDTDYRHARGLDKALYQRLLACTLAHQACRMGRSAYYVRLPPLLDELAIGRTDGRYMKLLRIFGDNDACPLAYRTRAVTGIIVNRAGPDLLAVRSSSTVLKEPDKCKKIKN